MQKNIQRIYKITGATLVVLLLLGGPIPSTFIAYADATSTAADGGSGSNGSADGGAVIQTGDASSQADSQNIVNTNVTTDGTSTDQSTNLLDSIPPEASDIASSTSLDASTTDPLIGGDATTDATNTALTATSTNSATTTVDTSASASTGGNAAGGGDGSATVVSGNAIASANVINVVNTNIVNSTGLFEFLNTFFGGGTDLRNLDLSYFFNNTSSSDASSSSDCSLSGCGSSLTVNNTNNATTTNNVTVTASTGGNTATSTGNATIVTGNAYASANVVNVVNTNLVNSRYLLVALNNFGDLGGDITLPNASFFQRLMGRDVSSSRTDVSNTNNATLDNTTGATASTGNNTAGTETGSTTVATGNALSSATTYNQVNTNLTGGSTVFLLVNVFGNWSGSVQGLPAGLSWERTQNGIVIASDGTDLSALGGGGSGSTNVSNTNNANVDNNVQVYALTGDNEATSSGGSATIATGNAYASSNVVNMVNTNVIGQNWMLAIMNIYGSWNGDLAFGHPDLWIGGVAQAGNPAHPGSSVTYTFTVANRGDADATGVVLDTTFDGSLLSFSNGSAVSGGNTWNLGDISAGQTKEFSYTATTGNTPGGDTIAVPLSATVTEDQHDNNMADNTENVTITVGDTLPGVSVGGANIGQYQIAPKLTITKTASVSTTTVPATVDYKVVIDNDNNAGPAYNAVLADKLVGPDGKIVYSNSWPLDTVYPGDEITLTYSVQYGADSLPGTYTDTSLVTGWKNYTKKPYANDIDPVSASADVEVVPTGQVLGASTSTVEADDTACYPLLTTYIRRGHQNSAEEVRKLQNFLNNTESNYGLAVTGIYDAPTIAAVKDFQQTNSADVLAPWGISSPTGNVYYTTQLALNSLYCHGKVSFTLSSVQQKEIAAYHDALRSLASAKPDTKVEKTADAPTPQGPTFIDLPPMVPMAEVQTATPEATSNVFQATSSNLMNVTTLVSQWLTSWAGRLVPTASAAVQ